MSRRTFNIAAYLVNVALSGLNFGLWLSSGNTLSLVVAGICGACAALNLALAVTS